MATLAVSWSRRRGCGSVLRAGKKLTEARKLEREADELVRRLKLSEAEASPVVN